MKTRIMTTKLAAAAALALLLAGCANGGGTTSEESAPAGEYGAPSASSSMAAEGVTSLSTAETELGQIVVDGKGMTVYQFDKDTQGADTSACTDECLAAWPPVHGEDVELDGVTGEVGTITGNDGQPQLTLNGWPLYYFASDKQAGDTTGQGVKDVWWVLDPAGEPIK